MPVLCSKDNVRSTTRIQAPPRRIQRHQLSTAIYTKDPTKDRKYKEVLKIFCVINHRTVPPSSSRSNRQEEHQSPLSASSAIAEATVGAGRKRRVHHNQNQEKPGPWYSSFSHGVHDGGKRGQFVQWQCLVFWPPATVQVILSSSCKISRIAV